MASSVKPQLSLGEKLKVAVLLLTAVPARLALYSANLLFYAATHGLSLRYYFICAQIKAIFWTFSGRQLQFINPTGDQTYKAWLEQKIKRNKDPSHGERLVCDIQPLPVGQSNILWLGNRRKASKIVLFFHGGGFVLPIQPGHLEWCWNAYVVSGAETGTEVAVAVLQYTLVPTGRCPTQLRQAAAALSELLDAGFQPKDIIIGGDSAGGCLTMQLLHHLIHPHVEARTLKLAEPLAGAFTVSPWLGRVRDSPSFRNNQRSDMLTNPIMDYLTFEALGKEDIKKAEGEDDSWTEPLEVDESWLRQLDSVTKVLYVTVGGQELLADHGIEMVKTLKRLNTSVDLRLDASEKEAHDFILLEGWLGEIGDATLRMKEWFGQFLVRK